MTATETTSPLDQTPVPDFVPFSWLAPTDEQVAAALADDRIFPVIADHCGCVEDYGQVTTTCCGLHLCGDHAAEHRCPPCDADARYHADPDD